MPHLVIIMRLVYSSLGAFSCFADSVLSVAWSPSSSAVATGGADDAIYLWQVANVTSPPVQYQ